jgi:putative oxidoreductase
MSTRPIVDPQIAVSSNRAPVSKAVQNVSELAGRLFLSALFVVSGLGKITAYSGTAAYMSALGVTGALLPLAIVTEIAGAAAIIVGWNTRLVAFLLAGYSLLTAILFHSNFSEQIEMVMFLKNVSIAGGLLLLVANGAGPLSLDRRAAR